MKLINLLLIILFCTNCDKKDYKANSVSELIFVGEKIVQDSLKYKNTIFGGLSSIDYSNGKYYMISDDENPPVRFYEAELNFDNNSFSKINITKVTIIKNENGNDFSKAQTDPEALRHIPNTNNFIWTSEGNVKKNINPSIREITSDGKQIKELSINKMFTISTADSEGILHNGTFEGISIDSKNTGYWLSMELPIQQDGNEPKLTNSNSPIRISHIDKNGKISKQFAYMLDNITRDFPENTSFKFQINGVVEILAVNTTTFLVLERSYTTGYSDGGNTVKIYKVSTTGATDISKISSLKNTEYTPVTKELLFDFESIRNKLTNGIVDNIEGMTFGKNLPNGNKSLILVADNNFSKFGKQLNQFIVLEVLP